MARMKLEAKIERRLWNLVCSMNGDGDTIRELAKSIARTARQHIAADQIEDLLR